jgi:hypothetical protein
VAGRWRRALNPTSYAMRDWLEQVRKTNDWLRADIRVLRLEAEELRNEAARTDDERLAKAAAEAACYSDHDEDIRTKGTCDYCGEGRDGGNSTRV